MKSLEVKKVRRGMRDYRKVVSLLFSAFPKDELIPLFLLRLFSFRRGASFLALYDNNIFAGLSYIVVYEGDCYIFHLAVDETVRGQGYSSRILSWITERYEGMNIILDVEALEKEKENYPERLKRVEFSAEAE